MELEYKTAEGLALKSTTQAKSKANESTGTYEQIINTKGSSCDGT